ncbi:hypothetical protein HN51_070863 [Arachis hypogaea]|uniref:uncharacterized protein n=1 Tax=Arachis hypogaea TaxID=3818 RepID=UPI003B0F7E00
MCETCVAVLGSCVTVAWKLCRRRCIFCLRCPSLCLHHRLSLAFDTDEFVIPSLKIDSDQSKSHIPSIKSSNSATKVKKEENIYLGPHRIPPSQSKQETNPPNQKLRLKQKLKEVDKRNSGTGRENKVDNLRELVGGGK